MKGINVKKIAAFAGVAILFGAAAVFADVTYGTMQLVDQNGQPTVKIYVGSQASISDGVAAANIAAKIANEAYKSSTLTATSTGTPTCTVGANVTGAGSCTINPNSESVTLTVNVPGTVAGTYQFQTLITNTIDRTLQNRVSDSGNDIYQTGLTSSDTSSTPLTPVRGTGVSSSVAQRLFMIGGNQFSAFATYNVVDNQAVSQTYTEQQAFWVGSNDNAVAYDQTARAVDVNNYDLMAYSLLFTDPSTQADGIPVCTSTSASVNATDDWTSCIASGDSSSETAQHRVPIQFMGQQWIISEMDAPQNSGSTALLSSTGAVNGGTVKLAQEAKYGIVNVGGILDTGVFQIRLSDISVNTGVNNTTLPSSTYSTRRAQLWGRSRSTSARPIHSPSREPARAC